MWAVPTETPPHLSQPPCSLSLARIWSLSWGWLGRELGWAWRGNKRAACGEVGGSHGAVPKAVPLMLFQPH